MGKHDDHSSEIGFVQKKMNEMNESLLATLVPSLYLHAAMFAGRQFLHLKSPFPAISSNSDSPKISPCHDTSRFIQRNPEPT
jgi:hypothetical protein